MIKDKEILAIESSLSLLVTIIEKEEFQGYDPYDGLESPIFKLPFFRSNKMTRFLFQQFVKRFPLNIRPVLSIKKGYNPVTLGLCIQSYSFLQKIDHKNKEHYLNKIDFLINELENLVSKGFSGSCWGYDFNWESRFSTIGAFKPTVVATGIITNALFICHKLTNSIKAKNLLVSATDFVINDLNKTYDNNDNICFSYSPYDNQQVLNASMKGARTLSQAFFLTNNEEYLKLARSAVTFVINHQNKDGSWRYSNSKNGGWVDNYHTGYILDCLDDFYKISGDKNIKKNIDLGLSFYLDNFVTKDGVPKFYNHNTFPIDCTSAGQCILTLLRLGNEKLAMKVAQKTIEKMQKNDGSFKFRIFKYYSINTSFMRWSNAWMLAALSYLIYNAKSK